MLDHSHSFKVFTCTTFGTKVSFEHSNQNVNGSFPCTDYLYHSNQICQLQIDWTTERAIESSLATVTLKPNKSVTRLRTRLRPTAF